MTLIEKNNWKLLLKGLIERECALPQIASVLMEIKNLYVSKDDVRFHLSEMRQISNEQIEDRILEVLDVVDGFCDKKYQVW